jgi:hypothetical protein
VRSCEEGEEHLLVGRSNVTTWLAVFSADYVITLFARKHTSHAIESYGAELMRTAFAFQLS